MHEVAFVKYGVPYSDAGMHGQDIEPFRLVNEVFIGEQIGIEILLIRKLSYSAPPYNSTIYWTLELTLCLHFVCLFPDHTREFSCGRHYYRTFYLDPRREVLYVGAM